MQGDLKQTPEECCLRGQAEEECQASKGENVREAGGYTEDHRP